ncbi:MAG: ABC transporter substrate-binding protein [Desulfobacterales bacterium]|nr:ABC transporter substrate-binding protein [Desulfobacterales bacterium]
MAVEEINARGGLFGRKMSILLYDDEGNQEKGEKIAHALSGNPDIIAVVGHQYSNIAIPVSITYEKNGIIFISTGATNPSLTRYSENFTFRNIPSDEETGRQLADYVVNKGYKKVASFYQRDFEGKRLAEIFNEHATEKNIQIVSKKSFFDWQTDFKTELAELKKETSFDIIFLAGTLPASAFLIKEAREMGINVPIIGGSGIDSPMLITEAGRAAEKTIVSTVFNPESYDKKVRDFIKDFAKKYGFKPDTWAAQGYDAISLIAHAIETSGSILPIVISSTLKFLENWEGVTGAYSFNTHGDIVGKTIFFKEVRQGKFVFLLTDKQEEIDPFSYIEESTLRLPVEISISTIDPGLSNDITSTEITEQLFLGLTDFDRDHYNAIPELAESWSVDDTGTRYQFKLRQDAVWTNGDKVTAHDIVWAIQRNLRPETKAPNQQLLFILKNAAGFNDKKIKDIESIGVRAIDDFTLEFILEYPAAYFPTILATPIFRPLPRKAIEQFGDQWTKPEHIQTNGSYQLALWEDGIVMVLRKNPKYYDAFKVKIPEVRYFILTQNSMGYAMYNNNELDIMGSSYLRIPFIELQNITENSQLNREYHQEPIFCTYAYAFNIKRTPVDNILVRKAISAAIDRELIIEVITVGGEEVAKTYTRPPVFGAVDPSEGIGIAFDPMQAQQWLAEAGYPNGKGFPGEAITLVYNSSETHKKIAEAIQLSLKYHLNIDIKLEEKGWDEYIINITTPEASQMFRCGWCNDYPDANNWLNDLFNPNQPMMQIGLTDSEFAQVLDKAKKESGLEIRKKLYKRAEQILCEEQVAVIPIYFETAHCLVKPRVKGWYHMALGGQHIRNWYLEEK